MKNLLFLLILNCDVVVLHAQSPTIYTIRADSVKITNDCDTAELIIENHTQHVPGFLYNKGRGRTEFRRATKLDDSTIVLGGDTIVIQGSVPPLQKVLDAGSHLTRDNVITSAEDTWLTLKTTGSNGLTMLKTENEIYESRFHTGYGDAEMNVTDINLGASAFVKIFPGEIPGIWVNDDFNNYGLFYTFEYSPMGEWDQTWIPHIGYVRKEISDSLSLMRDLRLQVKRTAVNNSGYSATATDNLIAFTSLTAPRTVTLLHASQMTEKIVIIKDESGAAGTHNITVNVTAGGTIDGTSSKTITTNYGSIELYSNGSQWFMK